MSWAVWARDPGHNRSYESSAVLLFGFSGQHMLWGRKHVAGMVTDLQAYCKMLVGGIVAKRILVMSCNEKIS